jgi:hypothetical protein
MEKWERQKQKTRKKEGKMNRGINKGKWGRTKKEAQKEGKTE